MNWPQTRLSRLGAVLFLALLAYQAAGYYTVRIDDNYIFYTYAENIATGLGYVFNPEQRVLGTTSPLYTLILALGRLLLGWLPGFSFPALAAAISASSMLVIGVAVAEILRRARLDRAAIVVPMVLLANPLVWAAVAMDALPAMALGLTAVLAYGRDRMKTTGLLCALAVLCRPDMLIVPGVLFIDLVVIRRNRPRLSDLLAFAVPLLAWFGFSWFYFGSLVPNPVIAKTLQPELGWSEPWAFLKQATKGWPFPTSFKDVTVVAWAISWIIIALNWRRFLSFRQGWLVLAWIALHMVAYGVVLDAPPYPWYYAPFALGISLMLAMAAGAIADWAGGKRAALGTAVVVVVLIWAGAVGAYLATYKLQHPYHYKFRFYVEGAAWLNEHVQEGDVVGTGEIGVISYLYHKGPVLDLCGLTDDNVLHIIEEAGMVAPVQQLRPDWLLLKDPPSSVEPVAKEAWFSDWYEKKIVLGDSATKLGIYKYIGPTKPIAE